MSKVIRWVRGEIVMFAGVIIAIANYAAANQKLIMAIIPIVAALLTRSQVSPVSKKK